MPAKLYTKHGDVAGEIGNEATIGRDPSNSIRIDSAGVSRLHARISYDREQRCYVIEDLDSSYGTEVDGILVTGRQSLGHLHVVTLAGETDLVFQDLELAAARAKSAERRAEPAATPEKTRIDSEPVAVPPGIADDEAGGGTRVDPDAFQLPPNLRAPRPPAAGVGDATDGESDVPQGTVVDQEQVVLPPSLAGRQEAETPPAERTRVESKPLPVPPDLAEEPTPAAAPALVLEFPDLRMRFKLVEGENVVGRAESAQVRVEIPDLSRRHAVLKVQGRRVTVKDFGSTNRTFVNDREVKDEVEVPLDARLAFGSVAARLVEDGD